MQVVSWSECDIWEQFGTISFVVTGLGLAESW